MHHRLGRIGARAASACAAGAFVLGLTLPAGADVRLPVIDIVPTTSFTTTSDGTDPRGGPKNPPPTNGDIEINGTFMLPIAKNLTLAYNRISLGAFDSHLSAFYAGGQRIYPGGSRDLLQSYSAAYHFGRFNLESGIETRYRRCCPAGSFGWSKGFVGLSYVTPSIALLNGGFFVLGLTGNSSHHFSSTQALASFAPGLSLPNNTQVYTTQQAITAIVPVDKKHGVRTATTFLWGALDYPVNGPFPLYYDVVIVSATKQFNPYFGLTANLQNVIQRKDQGYPFPPNSGIRTAALNLAADFHVDFNSFVHHAPPPATTPGRPTEPGAPGGPGGPAQVGPTQGGTVTPAPQASPTP